MGEQAGSIIYRQATEDDKEDIFSFYRHVYPEEAGIKCSEMWKKEFVDNPYRASNGLGIWIAIDEHTRRIMGHSGVVYEAFKLFDYYIKIGWGVDLIVDPAYRGKNIASNLQKLVMENVDAYMNISMAESTRRLYLNLGAVETTEVYQMIFPMNVLPERVPHYFYLRTFSKNNQLNKALRRLIKLTLAKKVLTRFQISSGLSRAMPDSTDGKGYSIVNYNSDEHSDVIDGLWKKYENYFCNSARRDKTYFDWKYNSFPFKNHFRFIVANENIPVGYLVLRIGDSKENNVGIIVDYLLDPSDKAALEFCIAFSKQFFLEQNVEYIYSIASDDETRKKFIEHGFKTTRIHLPIFLSKSKALSTSVMTNNTWQLTFTDHELDRYPLRGK